MYESDECCLAEAAVEQILSGDLSENDLLQMPSLVPLVTALLLSRFWGADPQRAA
jgi:hypothetical protein